MIKKLENGLNVVLTQKPNTYTVAIKMTIFSGSRFDGDKPGMAHLAEHTMCSCSKEVLNSIENAGGEINVLTSKEFICFDVVICKDKYKQALEYLYQIIANFNVEEQILEDDKKTVLCEILEKKNKVNHWHELLTDEISRDHPYSSPSIGTIEGINSINLKDLQDYSNRYLNGRCITLIVTGSINCEESFKTIESIFGRLSSGNSIVRPYELIKVEEGYKFIDISIKMPFIHYVLGFPAVNVSQKERILFDLLRVIVFANEFTISRAYKVLRENNKFQYSWNSILQMGPDMGFLAVTGKALPDKFEAIQKLLDSIVDDLIKEKISEIDLEMGKEILLGRTMNKIDNNIGMNNFILMSILSESNEHSFENYCELVSSLTKKDMDELIDSNIKKWRLWITYGERKSN